MEQFCLSIPAAASWNRGYKLLVCGAGGKVGDAGQVTAGRGIPELVTYSKGGRERERERERERKNEKERKGDIH